VNTAKVIKILKNKYPGRAIIENKNEAGKTTEIICEIDPTEKHPEHSTAIAVIDTSTMHYHKMISETYKVLDGELKIFKYFSDRKSYEEKVLRKGEALTIQPGEIHINNGRETWVEVTSRPGWTVGDYINIEVIVKKYLKH
jgi:hypothetical protein